MRYLLGLYFFSALFLNARGQTQEWFSIPQSLNENVSCMTAYQGNLIIAGGFTNAGSLNCKNIASWDGASWSALGAGFPSTLESGIKDITIYHYATKDKKLK